MPRDLSRLLNPKSIALFGGGWAANVIAQLKKSGFAGEIWPVHPTRSEIGGTACFKSLADLPSPPDASFVGINREATIPLVRELSAVGAGGATCFASGFRESEDTGGGDLQAALIEAAGDMPILGPNCYGFLNYLDNVTLWPDEHGCTNVESGVGIIAQSSNIAINMTMQRRNLPIGMLVAAGNQAQTGIADIALTMVQDERITAIGLYLEGLGDVRALEAFMTEARAAGKPVVVLKTGKSESARKAAITHTASMSGSAAFSSALFRRLGIIEVENVETFLEALKLLHQMGGFEGNRVVSVSCSGGEAGLVADMSEKSAIGFPPFSAGQGEALKKLLGPIVTISNPLDYHTFIWGDVPRMSAVFSAVMKDAFDLCLFVFDQPRSDRCDVSGFECGVEAILAARKQTGANTAVIGLLPENISEELAGRFASGGVVTLNGLKTGLEAVDAAIRAGQLKEQADRAMPLSYGEKGENSSVLDEVQSKEILKNNRIAVPRSVTGTDVSKLQKAAQEQLDFPVVLKGVGKAHKTETGAVLLNLADPKNLSAAFETISGSAAYLVEEMAGGGIAELVVGISCEESGVQMLTIGAGGIYTELVDDTATLLLPVKEEEVRQGLKSLRIWPMLDGYRGRPKADIAGLVATIMAIADVAAQDGKNREVEVNPLIVREDDSIAVDALIVEWN